MKRFIKFLPVSRIGMILWAWKHRVSILEWITFAIGAFGRPREDVRAELALRMRLRRFSGLSVSVDQGVARLEGRLTPQSHAAAQDAAVATPGIKRVDDRIENVNAGRRFFRAA